VQPQRPTVKDLVRLTGFSQGAISRAMNGKSGISEATRDKILKTAMEVGYQPNPAARNFKRGFTKRIGIILPNLRNPNYSELFEQLDLIMADAGYTASLALTHDSPEREADIISHWSAGETDALIIHPTTYEKNHDLYQKLLTWRYPALMLYNSFGESFDSIGVDYRLSLRHAVRYLQDVGHRKVAYVGVAPGDPIPLGKYGCLLSILSDLGVDFDEQLSLLNVPSLMAGPAAFNYWRKQDALPTAVVAYNDQAALSIISEAMSRGIRIPEDISVMGSDNIDQAEAVGLSTLSVDRRSMAKIMFDHLQNRMADFDSPTSIIRIRSDFIMRRTLAPPRSRD